MDKELTKKLVAQGKAYVRKVENPDCILGELNMENNRGGGYGHGGTK